MSDARFSREAEERVATLPGREEFERENAASLLRDRERLIQRMRAEIVRLTNKATALRKCLDNHHRGRVFTKRESCRTCSGKADYQDARGIVPTPPGSPPPERLLREAWREVR